MVLVHFYGLVLLDRLSVKGSGFGTPMDHGFDLALGFTTLVPPMLGTHSVLQGFLEMSYRTLEIFLVQRGHGGTS